MPNEKGFVVWFTGLPASGKTTTAKMLFPMVKQVRERVEFLDSDEVRAWFLPTVGYERSEWESRLRSISHIFNLLSRNGVAVIGSLVSPFESSRDFARRLIPNLIEVYVNCSLETCIKRDPKGLYHQAMEGKIDHMVGIQQEFEVPSNPDVIVETERYSPDDCAEQVFQYLVSHRYLTTDP